MTAWNQSRRMCGIAFINAIACILSPIMVPEGICQPNTANLQAGVAQVDITPPTGLAMYGYFDRLAKHQLATGILDPLYARLLVLDTGGKRVALVTLDLGRTFDDSSLDRLRTIAKQDSHIDELIVTASHTHSGPNILDVYADGHPPAWQDTMLQKISDAIHQAARHLEPARLGTGRGSANIGYNRRRVNPDNSVTMLWSNPKKTSTAPVDTTVHIVRIDRMDGTPLAILVNYACHPVVFGADNLQYSADYVATMVQTVVAAFPNKPLCLFLQGADGDINPYDATTPMDRDAVGRRDWTGRELGREAARIAQEIETKASLPSLDFADDVLVLPWRWDPQKLHDGLLRVNGPLLFHDHAGLLGASPPPSKIALHVTTLVINRQIALVGMPGEPFVDFQINLRDRCPVQDCLLLGYANGYLDYFPTILAASQGGYGAADSNTYLSVGAGERMLDHALIRIYEMLGELSPVPALENDSPRHR